MVATAMALGSCAGAPEERCTTLGREGGLMFSSDNVLAIAITPEALDEDTRFCIVKSERAPEIYGNAYRVYPNPELQFAAAVSYRFALPEDTEEINIGRVDAETYSMGMGNWESLTDCRVEVASRQVTCTDDVIAKFYGLLDDFDGPTSDSIADTGTGNDTDGPSTTPSGPTTNPTDPVTTDPTDTDPTDQTEDTGDDTGEPIVYPAECDSPAVSDFVLVEVGPLFDPFTPMGGSEDMAWDGHGGFVARSANNLVRLDISGAVPGGPVDAFVVEEVDTPSFPGTSTLGLRYRSTGDLVMMQAQAEVVELLRWPHVDGTLDEITDLGLPNGLFVDNDDVLWFSDFVSGDIIRYDVRADDDTVVGNTASPNGLVYDGLRQTLFYVGRTGDANPLMRQRLGASGAPIGEAVEITVLEGNADGISLDECGNLYIIDQDGGRLERLDLDDEGELEANDEILSDIDGDVSNALFPYGDPTWETHLFITGVGGTVFYVDVGRRGEQVPVPPDAPAVVPSDTTSTG